jgi:hypothetical protein
VTDKKRRPRLSDRGDANDLESGRADGIPSHIRRRRAASYRCVPLPGGQRDPLHHPVSEPLTDAELDAWRAAWLHLDRLGLCAIVPPLVLAAGRARRRDGDAA